MSAFLKIIERKGQLGLRLINHDGEFFLFSKALIRMWKNRGRYVRVKHHNAEGKSAIAYHPGEAVGLMSVKADAVAVQIYKGGIGKRIGLDSTKSLTNVVQRESYVLPLTDLEKVVAAFEIHHRHSAGFEELSLVGAPMVLGFDGDDPNAY